MCTLESVDPVPFLASSASELHYAILEHKPSSPDKTWLSKYWVTFVNAITGTCDEHTGEAFTDIASTLYYS